ncbi:hypothetical protein BD626DRAFT_536583 [Schizophyllum amplum]|uniref:Fungal-type protein kinase domain-containing protein n=1 Tax=Schizophyllum amplum TaxID=97359 RepID=A0A550CG82_9AGAR|nr:hypothetical protein BD626DRAFT_536583 [Auriculariopsis ampla]
MDHSRDAFFEHIGAVPQIPVNDFIEHFLPRSDICEATLDKLAGMLSERWRPHCPLHLDDFIQEKADWARQQDLAAAPYDAYNGYWTAFAQQPKDNTASEKDIFPALVNISEQIAACCVEADSSLVQTTRLVSNFGNRQLEGDEFTAAPPNGVRLLIGDDGGTQLDWHQCVCIEGYRKSNMEVLDNNKKSIWASHHIMRTDATRRATTSMTVNNTQVTLWHYDREVLLVSAPFDINKDFRYLIAVYAHLSFASLTALGYDTTIQVLPDRDPIACAVHHDISRVQYLIRVQDTLYITVKYVANRGPENGFGRCTRVFSAYKAGGDVHELFIIKDCWLEANRETEWLILNKIRAAIQAHDWDKECVPPPSGHSPGHVTKINGSPSKPVDPHYGLSMTARLNYFVNILAGVKVTLDDGQVDDTQRIISRGYQFADQRRMYSLYDSLDNKRSHWEGVVGNESALTEPKERRGCFFRPIVARAHHRLVMKPGIPLSQVENANEAFSILTDAGYALFLLHSVGWLYRDISPDNILQMPDGGGVLADLEYAKEACDPRTRSFRTGTPNFLAVEVANRNYLQSSDSGPPPNIDKKAFKATIASAPDKPWYFRDVHDLESLWWLCMWLLFRHTTDSDVAAPYSRYSHAEKFREIFPGTVAAPQTRVQVLSTDEGLYNAITVLPSSWQQIMGADLCWVRSHLFSSYAIRNRDERLYPKLWLFMHEMCEAGTSIEGRLVRVRADELGETVQAEGAGSGSENGVAKARKYTYYTIPRTEDPLRAAARQEDAAPSSPSPAKKRKICT